MGELGGAGQWQEMADFAHKQGLRRLGFDQCVRPIRQAARNCSRIETPSSAGRIDDHSSIASIPTAPQFKLHKRERRKSWGIHVCRCRNAACLARLF